VITVGTKLTGKLDEVSERILLSIAAVLIVTLATLAPQLLVILAVLAFLVGWLYLVNRDYILALTVFMALMPLWLFLKWVEWPAIVVSGDTIYLATILKEVFMIVFFGHWLVSTARNDRVILRILPALLGFFAFVAVALLQGGLVRYPMLLRPYIETFLLVAVPLLSIELDRRDIERLLVGVAVGGGITGVVALLHVFVDPQFLLWEWLIREEIFKTREGLSAYFGPRLQSFTGNPNNLGRMMLLTAVVAFGFTFKISPRENLWRVSAYVTLFAISTVVLMLSRSRDDMVLLAVAIVVFIVIKRQKLPLVAGAVIFTLGVLLNFSQISGTFETLLIRGNPRFATWLSGIQYYGWELLTGVGRVNNQFAVHNPYDSTYFRILLQTGAVGLLLFVIVNLKAGFALAWSFYSDHITVNMILLILLVVMLGTFTFTVDLLIFPFSLYYWFVLALTLRSVSEGIENQSRTRI
jgi:hypothetical protein